MYDPKEIEAILNTPDLSLLNAPKASDVLTNFYEALGWDKIMTLDPTKVITTKSVFNALYDLAYAMCPDYVGIGMMMVNTGPSTNAKVPEGKVYLLKGWSVSGQD